MMIVVVVTDLINLFKYGCVYFFILFHFWHFCTFFIFYCHISQKTNLRITKNEKIKIFKLKLYIYVIEKSKKKSLV